ncbi:MAG: right-handed parallel beta-helix repeat-containing protein, partial [Planctomycetota bacterium]
MKAAVILSTLLFLPGLAFSATIKIPDHYPTIQEGIDAAADGDIVLVAAGTYVENIDFKGKAITVASESGPDVTVIDGNQAGGVVIIIGSDSGTELDGFTITNGTDFYGGGIFSWESSPVIKNNLITGNTAKGPSFSGRGGGICCEDSTAIITCNIISNNTVEKDSWLPSDGGGIHCFNTYGTIVNNVITGNKTPDRGGGLYCFNSDPIIGNNLIVGNEASNGGGIHYGGAYFEGFIENNTIAE